jgi:hypothetical protein
MIKDYQNKEALAAMKRQLNEAIKSGCDREARITFVLIHMLSERHELIGSGDKQKGEDNLFRFMVWNLERMTKDFEMRPDGEYANPIDVYRKEGMNLLTLARWRNPAKDAVKKGLEEWQEWPDDVPYEEWEEDMLHTAYITLFGLYYFDTPAKDLMRWLGKDEPKNPKFVNAMNRHETITNISVDRMGHSEHNDRPKKKMFISDEEFANGVMGLNGLRERFKKLVDQIAKGDTLRFCQEKEETAFGVFMSGLFAMMMPGEDVNRKGMVGSKENARMVYQFAKKMLMGDVVTKGIVTADDDNAAAEVFYWGLVGGEDGVRKGTMPTGLGEVDIEVKPSQTTKN